jgi:cell division protein FtsB
MEKRIRVRGENSSKVVESRSDFSNFFDSIFVKIALIAISSFIIFSVYNSLKITFQKLEILKQAESEVEELRIQNLYLSLSIKEMSTDRYLEKEARNRLNFGGNEEVVFVIPTTTLEKSQEIVLDILSPEEVDVFQKGFNLSEWVTFVGSGI